ncbi:MAG: PDZ domain-containing protein, partial [Bacteroidales bacterium]|nr:PDZ domain-containing protein [Bacteroidales bacterium]
MKISLIKTATLALAICTFSQVFTQPVYQQTYKFGRFIDYLDRYYVDTVNTDKIVEEAIIDILSELDPHSVYITEEDFAKMNEPLQGNFEGIGISFNILQDTLIVISPISGGPSEKIGILAGDRIINVDGKNIGGIGITNEDVYTMLRGKKGTKVTVGILRRNIKEILDFTITRDKIPIYSLDASYMINDEVGYIKLNRFSASTVDEFQKALEELKTK